MCGGDWMKSTIMVTYLKKISIQKEAERVWMSQADLEERFGKEGAEMIIARKETTADCMYHPEFPNDKSRRIFRTLSSLKEVDQDHYTQACTVSCFILFGDQL